MDVGRVILQNPLGLLAALLVGAWFVGSTVGREFLRHALEEQLSDLMEGEVQIKEIEFELHSGLGLRGYDVGVYPSTSGPNLFGREVYAELNETVSDKSSDTDEFDFEVG